MAFFTPLSTNSTAKRLARLLALALCCSILPAWAAEGISHSRAEARVTTQGQMAVSTRFDIRLPDQLQQALQQGVPLHFDLAYQLTAPTLTAYRLRLNNLVGNDQRIRYRLSYHPLTSRYRVSMGNTFATEYNSLDTALRAVGAAANWLVLDPGTLSAKDTVRADVRLNLSISQLPKPFQINALTSKGWQLDSGWQALSIRRE